MKFIVFRLLFFIRFVLSHFIHFQEISILCYHSISSDKNDTTIAPDIFRNHLKVLKNHGYQFMPLRDVVAWFDKKKELPRKVVSLTFDDGYANFIHTAKPILDAYNAPATIFVLGDRETYHIKNNPSTPMLSENDLEVLKADSSVEIGYHTMTHPDLRTISGDNLIRELKAPFPVSFFAYPGGNYSDGAREKLNSLGYRAAFSIKPELVQRTQSRYLLPRSVVTRRMSALDILMHASIASTWYRMLRRAIKYG